MYPFSTIYIKPIVRSNVSFFSPSADSCDGHDYAAKSAYKEYEIEPYINSVVQAMENLRGTIGIVEKAKQEASITSDIIRYAGVYTPGTNSVMEANFYNSFTDKVEEQLKTITGPLQQEAETTGSVWVKIRNRFYIRIINNAVDNIIKTIQDGLDGLSKK